MLGGGKERGGRTWRSNSRDGGIWVFELKPAWMLGSRFEWILGSG